MKTNMRTVVALVAIFATLAIVVVTVTATIHVLPVRNVVLAFLREFSRDVQGTAGEVRKVVLAFLREFSRAAEGTAGAVQKVILDFAA